MTGIDTDMADYTVVFDDCRIDCIVASDDRHERADRQKIERTNELIDSSSISLELFSKYGVFKQ